MIPTTQPPAPSRQLDNVVATDRAIAGPDKVDRNAVTSEPFRIDRDPEPVNRRGRRFEQREQNRSDRRTSRSLHRQDLAQRAAR